MPQTLHKKSHILIYTSLFTCILSIAVFTYFLFQTSKIQNQALATSYSSDQIILAVNQQRVKNNLKSLLVNPKLTRSAQAKADDMANLGYFSHKSPSNKKWSDFIKEAQYDYAVAGENLANGFDTVNKMVDAWMNSPSHKENIVNKEVVETGIGVAFGKLDNKPTIFVTQHFGKLDTPAKTTEPVSTKQIDKPKAPVNKQSSSSSISSSTAKSAEIKPIIEKPLVQQPKASSSSNEKIQSSQPNSLSELLTFPPQEYRKK